MKRILVVEDEPVIALGLRDSLKAEGYAVEVAVDGVEGEILAGRDLESPNALRALPETQLWRREMANRTRAAARS